MNRFICIHGHFYQPPRENAWLDAIEHQPSALPFHDWNELITAECYRPNAAARILDEQGRIEAFINNYERISFNFGPTLLSWLEAHAPNVYDAVLQADRRSRDRFSGHGSAIAQAYNHLIMPLANARDRRTQVRWGIRDFEHRFGRRPEGMWLPETAVDLDTLDALAEQDIAFTILEPHQVVPVDEAAAASDGPPELTAPRHPYRIELPSGRSIAVFAYDGSLAKAVAFERLLDSGGEFTNRLIDAFSESGGGDGHPQLVHIATDGETYGHHHRFGEMALAFALRDIDARDDVHLTNYGEYLERFPPTREARLVEETSWSCAHGIERWRDDCGCHNGAHPDWNQQWRRPLREGLDALRDEAVTLFETKGARLFADPWRARDDYIEVVLDRTERNIDRFLDGHAGPDHSLECRREALVLLEMQRLAMLMYTSCGWFFDDVAGIETRQILQYACRVVELGREVTDADCASMLLNRLDEARSNQPDVGTGRDVFLSVMGSEDPVLRFVAAGSALGGLIQPERSARDTLYGHDVHVRHHECLDVPDGRVFYAGATVVNRATRMERSIEYAGYAIDGEVGCAYRDAGESHASTRDAIGLFVRDLRDRGGAAIAEAGENMMGVSLQRLPIELRWRYLNGRWPQLVDAIRIGRPVDWRELDLLHAEALDLGAPLPHAPINLIHLRLNLDIREALRARPLCLEALEQLLERATTIPAPLDDRLLRAEASRFAAELCGMLRDLDPEVEALRQVATVVRDLSPMLPDTDRSTLRNTCQTKWPDADQAWADEDDPLREVRLDLWDALGLSPPTDNSES